MKVLKYTQWAFAARSRTSGKLFKRAFLMSALFAAHLICFSQYKTSMPGSYTDGSTWAGGIVPPAGADVTIAHAVSLQDGVTTANTVTVVAGGALKVNPTGGLMASNGLTIKAGRVQNLGGTINVGINGGGNKVLALSGGTLSFSSGIINVNGSVNMSKGTFIMTGGDLNIDPNSGAASTSVSKGTDIFSIASAVKTTVNGGTITFVDPPFEGNGQTLVYKGNSGNASWIGNTIVFGGNSGVDNSTASRGFNVDTKAGGENGSYLVLGDVIVNGGAGASRYVSGAADADDGLDVGGNLTVKAGSQMRTIKGGAMLRISGDILNYGTYCDLSGISFSSRTGPNTVTQRLKRFPGATFMNSLSVNTATAHFTGFEFNNIAKPKAIIITNGSEDPTERNAGVIVSGRVAFINGIVDIGQYVNQIQFTKTATISAVNGGLLRNGIAQLCKRFPTGSSSFTFYVADSINNYEVTPLTLNLTGNTLDNRLISVNVEGKPHPFLQQGGRQTNYLKRYWRIFATPGGRFNATATFNYSPDDVVGSASNLQLSRWNGRAWGKVNASAGPNSFTISINQSTWTTGSANEITARSAVANTTARTATNISTESLSSSKDLDAVSTNKISVYPNPVTDGHVNLRFTSLPSGKYNIGIFNNNGQQVYANSVVHNGGSATNSATIPGHIQPGSYYIIVSNKTEQVGKQNVLIAK